MTLKVKLSKCPLCESGTADTAYSDSIDDSGNPIFSTTFRCGNVTYYSENGTVRNTPTDLCRQLRNVNLDTRNSDLELQLKQRVTCPKCKSTHKSDKYVCEKCANELGEENKDLCLALVALAVRYIADGYAPLPPGRIKATVPTAVAETKALLREVYVMDSLATRKGQLEALEKMAEKKWKLLR